MAKRILVVDDSFSDRMILRDCLQSIGYSVVGEAKDGLEAVDKYKKLNPDLVLMDAAIPDSDGISPVMKILRINKDAAIIICASNGQRRLAMEAVSVGAMDFVIKPVNPRTLHKVIHSAIG
ncbi:MAG: response regulator [Armatimonadota bacterium]